MFAAPLDKKPVPEFMCVRIPLLDDSLVLSLVGLLGSKFPCASLHKGSES